MTTEAQAATALVRKAAERLLAKLEPVVRAVDLGESSGDLYPQVAAAIDGCLAELAKLGLWGTQNRVPSSELWNVAGHLLARGWLLNRARMKPRGYAGDYEMLARIYENRLCDDPLGRLIDRYFQAQAAPQAVRNRMAMTVEWIVESAAEQQGPLKIAVVGSAFGLEVRDALARLNAAARAAIQVTLLDLDPAAVDFAGQQLQSLLNSAQL